jgi:RNA polymerase sigma factor (sigma-70 family)
LSDALVQLLRKSGPELHAMLTRLTLRPDRAADLMQELFLKLHGSAAFGAARDPRAYAFRAAIHLALDDKRRERTHGPLPEFLVAAGMPPVEAAALAEEAARLMAVVAELTPLAREAAVLHFIEQQPHERVAAIMGKTAHQVRALCQDALQQLRVRFGVSAGKETSCE